MPRKRRIGENNPNAKLKWEDIPNIKAFYFEAHWTQKEIARLYDVSQKTISNIIRGVSWNEQNY